MISDALVRQIASELGIYATAFGDHHPLEAVACIGVMLFAVWLLIDLDHVNHEEARRRLLNKYGAYRPPTFDDDK